MECGTKYDELRKCQQKPDKYFNNMLLLWMRWRDKELVDENWKVLDEGGKGELGNLLPILPWKFCVFKDTKSVLLICIKFFKISFMICHISITIKFSIQKLIFCATSDVLEGRLFPICVSCLWWHYHMLNTEFRILIPSNGVAKVSFHTPLYVKVPCAIHSTKT